MNTLNAPETDKFPKLFLTKRVQKVIIIQIGVGTASEGGLSSLLFIRAGQNYRRDEIQNNVIFIGDE